MKTKAWIRALRLRTLPLAISVILAGTVVSTMHLENFICDDCPDDVYAKAAWKNPDFLLFILTIITTLLLQIVSNLANDYGDFSKGTDSSDRIGPTRAMQSGDITKKEMLGAIILFSILSFVSGLCLLYFSFTPDEIPQAITFIGIGIVCIIAAIKYTMGKNPYGYSALGDIAVLLFFGGVGILGTQYLQIREITQEGIFIAIAFGFWSAAVLNLNNMRDVENDIQHKKFTLAYYFGFTKSKIYQAKLVLIPYIFTFLAAQSYVGIHKALITLIPLLLSILMLIAIIKVKNRADFDKFLKIQALLTLLNSIVLFTCIYLLHG